MSAAMRNPALQERRNRQSFSRGGVFVVPPRWGRVFRELARLGFLPAGGLVVVLFPPGGTPGNRFFPPSLFFTHRNPAPPPSFLTRHYSGWMLDAIRSD